jgi:hypothetical protein
MIRKALILSLLIVAPVAHAQDYRPLCTGIARVAPDIALARDNGVALADLQHGFILNDKESPGHRVYTTRLMNVAGAIYHAPKYAGVTGPQVGALSFADCLADPAK